MTTLTPEALQHTLKAIRRDGDRARSSLTNLGVVRARRLAQGYPDDPTHQALALADVLRDLVVLNLRARREATADPAGGGPREPLGEREWIARDFQAEDADRHAWSGLYHRYFAAHLFRATEICAISGYSARHIRRCFALGHDLVARALAEAEAAAIAGPPREGDAPPIAPLHGNLPRRSSSLVGRAAALVDIRERLRGAGILTLMGAGGVGKTRLAVEAARSAAAGFPDGAWFVPLDALQDGALVAGAVARVLDVEEQPGRPAGETLAEALAERRLLLVLDNCEHVIDACARLADQLVSRCPGLCILATSRKRLDVEGEQVKRVAALVLPAPGDAPAAERLLDYSAVRLFVERAAAVPGGFRLEVANAPAVVDLCRRLDGIPLAIELVAPHARRLTAPAIATQIDELLPRFTDASHSVPDRHKTVRAAIAWSHRLMTEAEKQLFARLAIFHGGWTPAAAAEVCAGGLVEPEVVEDILFRLYDSSLIVDEARHDEPRGRYLDMLRAYAREQLAAGGELADLARRHADFFTRYAEAAEPELKRPDQVLWLNRLEADHDNLRAAIGWALESGEAEIGMRLGGALWRFWYTRGYVSEGLGYLEQVLAADDASAGDSARAKAMHAAGTLAINHGDYERAERWLSASLSIRKGLEDAAGMADVLNNLANVAYLRADYRGARELYIESLAAARRLGDAWKIANTLSNLVDVAFALDEFESEKPWLDEALQLFRSIGDSAGVGATLHRLGSLAHRKGDFSEAYEAYTEALAIALAQDNSHEISQVRNDLGGLLHDSGNYEAALHQLSCSLELSRQTKDLWGMCRSLGELGSLYLDVGDITSAEKHFTECLVNAEHAQQLYSEVNALVGLGRVKCRQGDLPAARQLFADSLVIGRKVSSPLTLANWLVGWLDLLALESQPLLLLKVYAMIDQLRSQYGYTYSPSRSSEIQEYISVALCSANPSEAEVAMAEGRLMSLNEILALIQEHESQSA